MRQSNFGVLLAIGLLLGLSYDGTASSFRSNGLGARARGMGGAYVAIADDTSAGFWNPAGLAYAPVRLTQAEGKLDRIVAAYTPPDGARQQNQVHPLVIPALGTIIPLGHDRWPAFELLAYVPYGQQLAWDEQAAYRYNATFDEIQVLSAGTATAWRVCDHLSVGAGVFLNKARITLENKVPSSVYAGVAGLSDASFSATGSDTRPNYHLGALWQAQPALRVGAAYRSSIDTTIHGDARLILPQGATVSDRWELPLELPQSLSLGVAWQATPATLLAAQADWVDWSVIHSQQITFRAGALPNTTVVRNWKDRMQLRVGGEQQVRPHLFVRAGYSYDPTPVPAATLDPLLFDVNRHIVAAGIGCTRTRWALDLSYEHFFGQSRTTTTSIHAFPTNGTYTGKVDIVTATVSYRL